MEEMFMDAKEVQSNLYSLKRLYGLVKCGSSSTESDVPLDGHARLLLKNLLDTATRKVLKIVTGQADARDPVSPAEQHQPAELPQEQSVPLINSILIADNSPSIQKEFGSGKDRMPDGSNIPLRKGKSFAPQLSQVGAMEQPIQNDLASGPEYRTRRCRICRKNSLKQLGTKERLQLDSLNSFSDNYVWNSNQKTGSSSFSQKDESKSLKGVGAFERNLSGTEHGAFPSDRIATGFSEQHCSDDEAVNKPEEVDLLSKEASKAIEQIESGISAFDLGAAPLNLFEGRSAQPQNFALRNKSEGSTLQTKYGAVPSLYMSQNNERYMGRNYWQCDIPSQRVGESARQTMRQAPRVTAEEIYPRYLSTSQTSNLVQPTRAMWEQSVRSSKFIRSRGPGWGSEVCSETGKSVEGQKFQKNFRGQNVQAIIDELESENWTIGHKELIPSQIQAVQNFSLAMNPNETSYTNSNYPAIYRPVSQMRNPFQSHVSVNDDTHRYRLFQTYMPADSMMNQKEGKNIRFVDPGLNISSISGPHCRTSPPKVLDADVFDKKHHQLSLHPGFRKHQHKTGGLYEDGISRNRNYMTETKVALPHRGSDITTDSYTSNGRSQQTNSLYDDSESEEYPQPDNSRETEYVSSKTCSETGTGSLYTRYTNNNEDQSYYSSTCGGAAPEASSSSSSASVDCSSLDPPINRYSQVRHKSRWSQSKKSGHGWTHRSSSRMNCRKPWGVWRRLKDKLAVIFHHHHHHYCDDRGNGRKKLNRGTSLRKQRSREVKAERAVEKTRKSLIVNKNQQSHFRGLMGGFLRHVRRSKKLKQGKETSGPMAKSQKYFRKKALERPNCSRLVQQRRSAKLPKKTHLNLKLGKINSRLEALPKLK